jgi:hypothetical protein
MAKRFWELGLGMILALVFAGCSSGSETYGISGTVIHSGSGLEDVTMTLSNGSTVLTDSAGDYSFSGLSEDTYTVVPSLSGYTFSPTSQEVTIDGATVTAVDFVATGSATYTISGSVTYGGSALSGVTITLSGDDTGADTTDSDGNYSFTGLSDGDYTVTPTRTRYSFSPSSEDVTIDGANESSVDFTAY